jgi:hypothetical protein
MANFNASDGFHLIRCESHFAFTGDKGSFTAMPFAPANNQQLRSMAARSDMPVIRK